MNKDFYIDSEIGTLKKVLLHRPDVSLNCLNKQNMEHFLFDDVPDLQKAIEEHDFFADKLREHEVEVLYSQILLEEVISIPSARKYLISKIRASEEHYIPELQSRLSNLSMDKLLNCLTAGITKNNFHNTHTNEISLFNDYLLLPLPNQMYMRDTSSWLYDGIVLCNMASPARSREILNLETIYKFHPLFQKTIHPFWYEKDSDEHYSLEGGDILFLGNKSIIIGLSQRTNINSVRRLLKKLLMANLVHSIIVVQLPLQRRFMHLDTIISMIDYDAFIFYKNIAPHLKAWLINSENFANIMNNEPTHDFLTLLKEVLKTNKIRFFSLSSSKAEDEQWNDANNLLTLKPGVVMAYECNTETNKILTQGGINVIELPYKHLSKGRGGPRCLSCPLKRE